MPPKSKKQKISISQPEQIEHSTVRDSALGGTSEDPSNSQKAILSLPVELRDEILDYYPRITFFTETPHDDPVLPKKYKIRRNVLRALSQLCVAYRRVFFPALWESLDVCFLTGETVHFYRDVGKAIERHCDGISATPAIKPFIRTANFVLTRYNTGVILPKLRSLLPSLQNLHTLHLLHTHTAMAKHLREAFRDQLVLPNIRTLVIQGYCHDVLRCCPNVVTVWCIRENGSKLIPYIKSHCPKVEELRGFDGEENIVKRIVKAVPNLREFEVMDSKYEPFLKHIHSFKKFNTLVIRTPHNLSHPSVLKCIQAFKQKFKDLPATGVKRRIRVLCALLSKQENYLWGRRMAEDAMAEDAMAEDAMAEDAMAEDAMAEDAMAEDAMAEDVMAEDADRCAGKYSEVDLD